ncbi:hypothetical protein BBJ41_14135 [Burkholderia stabilis]|uniref:hypothetical protein n=1 Tax=Burkholderia stabilis TaxID=95485 RepID=UPI000851A17D|nr:hypothetical protein [Burkholderia stabilis]AOR68573.1 hypothetical protein BBJ41_14135 [Burkholderia stabilis]HDR9496335.1 hypothetical protein [Burkholderia stabilis]HDR9527909.1 hypothetical protein [Burkholderia stabilis]HDR9535098.1 hypothetical protein [Burkholderia stabilis]HDR9541986.1 hypothetical protein [Burkholderia stabilis]
MSDRLSALRAALGAIAAAPFVALAAPPAHPDLFNAALCKPPFTSDLMDSIYNTAKAADPKPDESMLGAAVFRLPEPIRRDGFTTQNVVFTRSGIGVLVEGEVAGQLAQRYPLTREKGHLLGAASIGYARRLTARGPVGALILVSARQGPALKGKTLLACEMTSEEEIKALEQMEKK